MNNEEFANIANDIINNPEYLKLKKEEHHGLNRYDHSLRVARKAYKMSSFLRLDYVSTTRAALLHDFFYNNEFRNEKANQRYKRHPYMAINNAHKYFTLNSLEEDIIKTHMFPLTKRLPSSKEAYVVIVADKSASLYEFGKYKFSMQLSIIILFIINLISFNK